MNSKLNKEKRIICQNCGAILADIDKHTSRIHLPPENIKVSKNGLIKLTCHCRCTVQYREEQ